MVARVRGQGKCEGKETVITAIQNALRRYSDGEVGEITAALRDHLRQFKEIRNEIGDDAIFAGRVPKGKKPAIAVKIHRNGNGRFADLGGESGMVAATIQVDVMSRVQSADVKVQRVSEMIRLATAGPSYRGYMGKQNRVWVHGITVERDSMETPTAPIDGSNGWHFQYSQDLRITHEQIEV